MNNNEIYDFFLLFKTLDPLKQAIIMVLAHSYPKKLTLKQVLKFSGYSPNSKQIFKSGALDALEQEGFIILEKNLKKSFLLSINEDHQTLKHFSLICQEEGISFQEEIYLELLRDDA